MDAPAALATCILCHGAAGISDSDDIPNLAGQKSRYLSQRLRALKSGERKSPVMNAIAVQLNEDDIDALARYWSRPPRAPAVLPPAAPLRSRMTFPAGFPAGFAVYDAVLADGQTTRRWANRIAWQAAAASRPLPDGSVIEVTEHASVLGADGKPAPGPALSSTAMASQAGWGADVPALLRNGNWDFALFSAAGKRRDGTNQARCLACHKPLADRSHVFTFERLAAAAAASAPPAPRP